MINLAGLQFFTKHGYQDEAADKSIASARSLPPVADMNLWT